MSTKLFTLGSLPVAQCYDCQGCGDCCRGLFAIAVTREEYDRIMGQGWEQDPALQGQQLFTGKSEQYFLAHRPDGACVFLNEQGLCRIHARFGEPAKPLACRLYPFVFVPVGQEARVDVRFDCPAVVGNHGRSITAYREELKALLPQVLPEKALDLPAPPLFRNVAMSWPHLCRMTDLFVRVLQKDSLSFTRRMLACVNFAALLRTQRMRELDGKKLNEFLDTVSAKVLEIAAEDALPRVQPAGSALMMFRQLLGVYGRADRIGERGQTWHRFTSSLRMLRGKGAVPQLRRGFPAVDFAAMEGSFGLPDADAEAVLARYYHVRLSSMGFFGRTFYNRAYLDGLDALLLTYPLILWFARAYAVEKGLDALDAACIEKGIQIISHQHGLNPVLDLPSERSRQRQLCERSTLRSLVIWYGS